MGIVYWGCGLEGRGWDLLGRNPGGFPRIDRHSDALIDSWKGRMENAQVTLRMCASEGPGFKRYVKHFMMLSLQACAEFRLAQYHRYNTLNKRKVLTERIVIGGMIDGYQQRLPNTGMYISNGNPGEKDFVAYLKRRGRRYRAQAAKLGGHFAAVILEGGKNELKFVAAARALSRDRSAKLKRILIILGGPDGISESVREEMRRALEAYTDFPLLSLALPGGTLHSYYALATVLVFHDQGLLIPFLESLGQPRPQPAQKTPPSAREKTEPKEHKAEEPQSQQPEKEPEKEPEKSEKPQESTITSKFVPPPKAKVFLIPGPGPVNSLGFAPELLAPSCFKAPPPRK